MKKVSQIHHLINLRANPEQYLNQWYHIGVKESHEILGDITEPFGWNYNEDCIVGKERTMTKVQYKEVMSKVRYDEWRQYGPDDFSTSEYHTMNY